MEYQARGLLIFMWSVLYIAGVCDDCDKLDDDFDYCDQFDDECVCICWDWWIIHRSGRTEAAGLVAQ